MIRHQIPSLTPIISVTAALNALLNGLTCPIEQESAWHFGEIGKEGPDLLRRGDGHLTSFNKVFDHVAGAVLKS